MSQKSYKFRIYPNATQRLQLTCEFGHARFVWNTCLAWRADAYTRGEKVTGVDFSRELTFLKKLETYDWLNDVSSATLTSKLRDQDKAFGNFFAKRAKYPNFKKRVHNQSVRYPIDQRKLVNLYQAGELLKLPKLGALKVRWSQIPHGAPKMVTLSLDASGRYHISFSVEQEISQWEPKTTAVGVDLGVKDVIVTSDGWKSGNPRHLRTKLARLNRAQRILSRRVKGSGRWNAQRSVVAKLHARVTDSRKDYLHKLTTTLVRGNALIAIEDLHVKGMVRNHCLAQAISDVGMGELRRQLEYKSNWHGRDLVVIDRWAPSTKMCSGCGQLHDMPLAKRMMECDCGVVLDRDVNAAINILSFAVGNTVTARGRESSGEAASVAA